MKHHLLITTAAVAVAAGAMAAFPSVSAAQPPPIGGGYTNVIPIPVDDPMTKVVSGALFKPEGAGPFPAVIYMSDCSPIGSPGFTDLEKSVIEHYRSKGFATLIVNSFTPRHMASGVCDRLTDMGWYRARAGDVNAATDALAAMPDIDPKKIFVVGYSHGAMSAVMATSPANTPPHKAQFAGTRRPTTPIAELATSFWSQPWSLSATRTITRPPSYVKDGEENQGLNSWSIRALPTHSPWSEST